MFFASLIAILYYLGVMQQVIRWIGGALEAITGISRVEALCAAANIFVGQSESPLVIRPYLAAPGACADVYRDDCGHGGCRGHDPGRVCRDGHPHRLPGCRCVHVGAGRGIDGQADLSRRTARAVADPGRRPAP